MENKENQRLVGLTSVLEWELWWIEQKKIDFKFVNFRSKKALFKYPRLDYQQNCLSKVWTKNWFKYDIKGFSTLCMVS